MTRTYLPSTGTEDWRRATDHRQFRVVMVGLVRTIHGFLWSDRKAWVLGTGPSMTNEGEA